MAGELAGQDPGRMRISDEDRHKVAEVLRQAAGEGRLDLEELDERLGSAYAARTYDDLVPLVVDLPGAVPLVPTAPTGDVVPEPRHSGSTPMLATGPRHSASLAIMGGQDRKGVWEVPAVYTAFALMGGIQLDLRQAIFTTREVVINANAVMGGIDIIVNAATRVSVDGIGIMGAFEEGRSKVAPAIGPGSPLVRVRGLALMAGVTVQRKPMPGEPRMRLGRAPGGH